MHDIADVKIEDPIILVFHSENSFHVVLQFDVACLTLLKSDALVFVDIVVSVLLCGT